METKKTSAEPFVIERTYQATGEKVWQAITDKVKMKQWYFDVSDFKPKVGFEFQFTGENEGIIYRHLCKVIAVETGKKLSYSWTYDGFPGYSVVTFELFSEGDKTRVKLTHEGLETFPDMKDFKRENFVGGWTQIIGKNLKEFVE